LTSGGYASKYLRASSSIGGGNGSRSSPVATARIANENPGLEVTRALAVKALLAQALDAVEAAPKHRGK
jgi:hypothetical protein